MTPTAQVTVFEGSATAGFWLSTAVVEECQQRSLVASGLSLSPILAVHV